MNSVSLCTDVEIYLASNSPHLFFWIAQCAIFIFMRIHVTEACETELYLVLINRFWFTHGKKKYVRSGQDLVVLRGDLRSSQVSLAALHGCDKDTILQHAFVIKYHFYCVIELDACFWSNNVCLVLWNVAQNSFIFTSSQLCKSKITEHKKSY